MKTALFLVMLMTFFCLSCHKKLLQGPTKILAGSEFYGYTNSADPEMPPPKGTDILKYSIKTPLTADIKETEGRLYIKPIALKELPEANNDPAVIDPASSDFKFSNISGKYYFPEEKDSGSDPKEMLRYKSSGIAVQTLGIPFKFRGSVDDTIPSQVETGFSGTLSIAWKFNWNTFRAEKNYLDKYITNTSFALGLIPVGLGTVSLNKANTFSKIKLPRTALVYSSGAFVMFGINNINFGFAGGLDWATGPESSKWMYQKKPWMGFVVGFDILK